MNTVLRHVGAIFLALLAWWTFAVVIGMALYMVWPPDLTPDPDAARTRSFMAGVSLGSHWQNLPGNVVGVIVALYAFRAVCPRPATVSRPEGPIKE